MSAFRTSPLPGSGRAGGRGTAWVAGTVRARSLARPRLGAAARGLAASASLEDATAALAATPYRRGVRAGQDLAGAQRGVTVTLLWHLRVLAGWLPRDGERMLRLLAGWFEIANVDDLLQRLAGRQAEEPLPLGALATTWPRCAQARSPPSYRPRWPPRRGATPEATPPGRCSWACACPGRRGCLGWTGPRRGRPERPRREHLDLAAQLLAALARARQVPELVGAGALSATDRGDLELERAFERLLVSQRPDERRGLDETFERAWRVLPARPRRELTMVSAEDLDAHHRQVGDDRAEPEDQR